MPKNTIISSKRPLSVGFLFDDTLDSQDGVAQQVKRLGEWLGQNGHHVVYICGETRLNQWDGGKVYSMARNMRVNFNGNRLSTPLFSKSKDIKKVLGTEKLDILHVQMPYSPLLAQRVISRTRPPTSIVGTFHILPAGWMTAVGSRLMRVFQWRSLRKFDYIISVSSSAAEFARRNFGIKSAVIPNMIDVGRFKNAAPIKPSAEKIAFLGRLVKRKGCEELIRAFALLSNERPQAKLVIAGDGIERQSLTKLVNKLNLDERVTFLGFIKEEDKPGILASASVACFPSLYGESFGIVLIEAMAAGAGVVLAGDNPGYRTVMEQQPKLLIDPRDSKAFAERLSELLDNKKLAAQLHAWQNKHVEQFDINIVGAQILDIYNQVIAKREQKRHN